MLSDANATTLARVGFAARGLVYVLVGWFAIAASLDGGETADNQGAIGALAGDTMGEILLGVVALGLVGYATWRLTEAIADPERIGREGKQGFTRAGHVVSGIAHLILAWTAGRLALSIDDADEGGTAPGDDSARDWTATLLSQPLGQVLVALVAVGLAAAAFQQAHRAWKGDFVEDLRGDTPTPGYVCTIGRIGYGARAVVFAIIGGFFAVAAWRSRASDAGGMAEALSTLQDQPGGDWLLVATGLGLILFGAYSFVEARFRRIRVRLPG